jgi:SAM-dependent methyltransferase
MRKPPKVRLKDSGSVWQRIPPRLLPGTLPLPEEFVTAARLARRVLDLGCGVGSALGELATEPFANWVGVDINPRAIALANKQAAANAEFLVHDARRPFPNIGTFDLFLLKGVLTCLPTHQEQLQVLRHATAHATERRVFAIVDFLQNWEHPRYRRRYELGLRAGWEKGTFLASDRAASLPTYLAHHFEYHELFRLLDAVGLRLVCSRDITVRTRSGNETQGFVLIAA